MYTILNSVRGNRDGRIEHAPMGRTAGIAISIMAHDVGHARGDKIRVPKRGETVNEYVKMLRRIDSLEARDAMLEARLTDACDTLSARIAHASRDARGKSARIVTKKGLTLYSVKRGE